MKEHDYAYQSGESLVDQMDREYNDMIERDAEAKAEGTIIGRFPEEPAADGKAYYQVIAVDGKNNTLQLSHLNIYDGWTIPMYEGMIDCFPATYALKNIEAREAMAALFKEYSK